MMVACCTCPFEEIRLVVGLVVAAVVAVDTIQPCFIFEVYLGKWLGYGS